MDPKPQTLNQVQGLPVALSGRDMIGIAFTGSGKTLVFSLPMIMIALEQECKIPVVPGEGPFGLCINPSRELARQTHDVVIEHCEALANGGFPMLKTLIAMGGIDMREQQHMLNTGCHMCVATPGRCENVFLVPSAAHKPLIMGPTPGWCTCLGRRRFASQYASS